MSLCDECKAWRTCDRYNSSSETITECKARVVDSAVDKPKHYHGDSVINFIEEFNFSFSLANVIKYCARADLKGKPIEDLEKARWYLEREIARRRKEQVP